MPTAGVYSWPFEKKSSFESSVSCLGSDGLPTKTGATTNDYSHQQYPQGAGVQPQYHPQVPQQTNGGYSSHPEGPQVTGEGEVHNLGQYEVRPKNI